MFEARKSKLEEMKSRFDHEFSTHSAQAHQFADQYLAELERFLREYQDSPAIDPRLTRIDTTGSLSRAADDAEWALREQRRVRKALADLV